MPNAGSNQNRPPLTPRGAILMTLSMIIALIGGGLTYATLHSPAAAVIASGMSFAGAWQFFDGVIDDE